MRLRGAYSSRSPRLATIARPARGDQSAVPGQRACPVGGAVEGSVAARGRGRDRGPVPPGVEDLDHEPDPRDAGGQVPRPRIRDGTYDRIRAPPKVSAPREQPRSESTPVERARCYPRNRDTVKRAASVEPGRAWESAEEGGRDARIAVVRRRRDAEDAGEHVVDVDAVEGRYHGTSAEGGSAGDEEAVHRPDLRIVAVAAQRESVGRGDRAADDGPALVRDPDDGGHARVGA